MSLTRHSIALFGVIVVIAACGGQVSSEADAPREPGLDTPEPDAGGEVPAAADEEALPAPPGTYIAARLAAPPTIDGVLDEDAWTAFATADKLVLGAAGDNAVEFAAGWDAAYLYVGIRVRDAGVHDDSLDGWLDDSVEIYIDADHNRGTTYDAHDRQLASDGKLTMKGGDVAGVIHDYAGLPDGYTVEVAIPWADLGVSAAAGQTLGFDIGNNDDDDGGDTRESQTMWHGTAYNYRDTSSFGALVLYDADAVVPDAPPPAPPPDLPARGAFMSWTYYEGEDGERSSGATLVTGTGIGQPIFEARGKRAVVLDSAGEFVEWTSVAAASHATVRYSMNDGSSGTLALYVDGIKRADLPLTSAKMREGGKPWVPGNVVRFFDEVMVAVPGGIPAGATVRLQKDVGGSVPYTVDFLDLDTAPPPLQKPDATWVEVAGHDGAAIAAAIAKANAGSKKVWLPPGVYDVASQIVIPAGIQMRGAGMWHTVIRKTFVYANARMFRIAGADNVMADFKAIDSMDRLVGGNCIIDAEHSTRLLIENVWTEYASLASAYRSHYLTVRGCRIRNGYKDAIHVAAASDHALIENNTFRNAGDDCAAFVSYGSPDLRHHLVRNNTVELTYWGRSISLQGGDSITVEDNLVIDGSAAGIMIAIDGWGDPVLAWPHNTNFVVRNNTVVGTGNQAHVYSGSIAIVGRYDKPMSGMVEHNLVLAPPFNGAVIHRYVGDAGTANRVYFRYNEIEAPTSAGDWQRKFVDLAPDSNVVHEPNLDR